MRLDSRMDRPTDGWMMVLLLGRILLGEIFGFIMASFRLKDPAPVEVARAPSLPDIPRIISRKTPRPQTSLPSSPVKRKIFRGSDHESDRSAETTDDSFAVEEDLLAEGKFLWWSIVGVRLADFNDWQLKLRNVNRFSTQLCGLLKSSPYFERMSDAERDEVKAVLNPNADLFESIAEHFEAEMNGQVKVDKQIVKLNAMEIGLLRYGNKIHAVQNVCPHQAGPLAMGDIEEVNGRVCITCPWHHWKFDLHTGAPWQPYRTDKSASVFPVVITDDGIRVGFPHYNPSLFKANSEF
ncbi:hypothetical protein BV898_09871 [Hypsibius exemplaris]|uniref:Rieske domain-containing protein n=1 Tax=Hypsibius exemplaris TaxID=2072580 RepID=A0A1W0WL94_HYPEX|nr:hypothetical protein BV898_09871 [Hypsibius exemplaris]